MLRTDVAENLRREFEEDGYLFPDYEGYCFGNVPHTVTDALGVETGRTLPDDVLAGVSDEFERVLVVLVDGFGFRQWRRERDHHALLDRLSSAGRVTPLTSIYPSETAAAMTTFHTGTLPVEHGVVGWNVYEPTADEEFESLLYRTKDGDEPSVPRSEVADADPLYPKLADAGVSSHHVVPFEDAEPGATTRSYESLDEFPAVVAEAVADAADPAYCFAYLDHVDAAAHESGTESPNYRETVGAVFDALDGAVSALDADGTADETLLVVTADHGHVNTDPERNVNLDRREDLLAALRRRADGAPVKFAGSMRNVHLHLRDDRAEEGQRADAAEAVVADLRADLDARVFEKGDLLGGEASGGEAFDGDLFGDAPASETFRRRLGDVVVCHRDLGVWWGDEEPGELAYVGMHGGLHPDEMLVPFAAVRADELVE
ncbi:alkaline phosphatase family protein [Halorussus salinus]|uniref:alkaline phosphatase family protein n=1 Tax=Halorussus salinus TaxID=1364935 RepID=UPI001092DD2D|nr:alkaline phosphatase family protein [Halorussus salinus]